jgi:hypothetical protein
MSVAFLQNLAGVLDLGQNRPLLDEVNCNAPSCGPVVVIPARAVCFGIPRQRYARTPLGESISNAAQNEAFERFPLNGGDHGSGDD